MPHVARAAVASEKLLQPSATIKSQAKSAIYLQRLSRVCNLITHYTLPGQKKDTSKERKKRKESFE